MLWSKGSERNAWKCAALELSSLKSFYRPRERKFQKYFVSRSGFKKRNSGWIFFFQNFRGVPGLSVKHKGEERCPCQIRSHPRLRAVRDWYYSGTPWFPRRFQFCGQRERKKKFLEKKLSNPFFFSNVQWFISLSKYCLSYCSSKFVICPDMVPILQNVVFLGRVYCPLFERSVTVAIAKNSGMFGYLSRAGTTCTLPKFSKTPKYPKFSSKMG